MMANKKIDKSHSDYIFTVFTCKEKTQTLPCWSKN